MKSMVRVAILENHQSVIDGYTYRLGMNSDIQIVGISSFGDELEPMLDQYQADILLMDFELPISLENHNVFPVRHALSKILVRYPEMKVIIVSCFDQKVLVHAMIEMGVRGYILKCDQKSIKNLARIVKIVADGGTYFSVDLQVFSPLKGPEQILTPRQIEALSLCVAYPNLTTSTLSQKMEISSSTFRNLLSGSYQRLGVRTRNAAVVRVQEIGLILSKTSSSQEYK